MNEKCKKAILIVTAVAAFIGAFSALCAVLMKKNNYGYLPADGVETDKSDFHKRYPTAYKLGL